MANQIGRALEELARATGSVAHLYRTVNLAEGSGRVEGQGFAREF